MTLISDLKVWGVSAALCGAGLAWQAYSYGPNSLHTPKTVAELATIVAHLAAIAIPVTCLAPDSYPRNNHTLARKVLSRNLQKLTVLNITMAAQNLLSIPAACAVNTGALTIFSNLLAIPWEEATNRAIVAFARCLRS